MDARNGFTDIISHFISDISDLFPDISHFISHIISDLRQLFRTYFRTFWVSPTITAVGGPVTQNTGISLLGMQEVLTFLHYPLF